MLLILAIFSTFSAAGSLKHFSFYWLVGGLLWRSATGDNVMEETMAAAAAVKE